MKDCGSSIPPIPNSHSQTPTNTHTHTHTKEIFPWPSLNHNYAFPVYVLWCRELLNDDNFHNAVQRVVDEPVPYFSQLTSHTRQSESVQQSAHRHIYAAGLEDIPVTRATSHPPTPSSSHTPQPSQSQCFVHSEGGEVEGGVHVTHTLSQCHFEEQEQSHASLIEETALDMAETDLKIKQ